MKLLTFLLRRALPLLSSVMIFGAIGLAPADAQTGWGVGADTGTLNPPPLVPLWNWSDTSFLIGAWGGWNLMPPTDQVADLWDFFDAMGIDLYIGGFFADTVTSGQDATLRANDSIRGLRRVDTLLWSADVAGGDRFVMGLGSAETPDNDPLARELEFYPFDSVQSPYYLFRFSSTQDSVYGVSRPNPFEVNPDSTKKRELRFDSTNTTPGTLVANELSFNRWVENDAKLYRWRAQTSTNDSLQDAERWIYENKGITDDYLVVRGHLFPDGVSALSDSLFKVEVVYEVPTGFKYFRPNTQKVTATADTSFPITTLYVTKNNLSPSGTPANWDEYRDVVFPLNLKTLANNARGPAHPDISDASRRFDVRVTWLGGEPVALRSVNLRNVYAQFFANSDSATLAKKQQTVDYMRRILFGSSAYNVPEDSLRRGFFGFFVAEELDPTYFVGREHQTRLIRDTFNVARPGGPAGARDSVGTFSAQHDWGTYFHWHHLTTSKYVALETYLWEAPKVEGDSSYILNLYGDGHEEIPSIREENGGRFHLNEIDLDAPDGVEKYERHLQQVKIGRYMPNFDSLTHIRSQDNLVNGGLLSELGTAARVSRATGRRLLQILNIGAGVDLRVVYLPDSIRYPRQQVGRKDLYTIDTLIGHVPTEAETKELAYLGLVYGSKGMAYWGFHQGRVLLAHRQPSGPLNDTLVWGTSDTIGANGIKYGRPEVGLPPLGTSGWRFSLTSDTTENIMDYTYHAKWYKKWVPRHTIPNLYVGFNTRIRAMKRVNARMKELGGFMTMLTWRDAYSVHYTKPWPLDPNRPNMVDFKSRPFKESEIIQEVTARHPLTGAQDSGFATFVEIGLYDKKTGTTNGVYDPLKDTTYVTVLNRRTFQRPEWISDTTARGKKMDSLASSRLITLRWNIPHPDTTQYPLIRIQEILPSTDTIPLIGARHVLDTVISGLDSTCTLLLGPGELSLLRITFPTPDTSMLAGDLRWPGQKKLIWDGFRYYSVFGTTRTNANNALDNVVVMRLSYPMADSTGAIIWIPGEFVLSNPLFAGDTLRTDNRFPSFTLNRQSYTTRLSIVWTCHPPQSTPPGDREVVIRNIKVVDYSGIVNPPGQPPLPLYTWEPSPLRTVDWHWGSNAEQYGTPVVSHTHGGVMVAWSDSLIGIVGRLFAKDFTKWTGPLFNPTFSARDSISWVYSQTNGGRGTYPSIPPYTPPNGTDSTLGIVWRQSGATTHDVLYQRIQQTATDAMVEVYPTPINMTPGYGTAYYPSIDITQYTTNGTRREGVVWEEDIFEFLTIQFQSLQTSSTPSTGLWNRATYFALENTSTNTWPPGELFPQTAVLGEHDTSNAGQGHVQYGIGYQIPETVPDLWLAQVNWAQSSFKTGWPKQYSYGGKHPNIASNVDQTWPRFALLYRANGGNDSTLRTSRQFFAKGARPVGYIAEGRDVHFRIDDSTRTGFHVLLYDPWFADASSAAGLPMVGRDSSLSLVDSISQVQSLFRTGSFTSSDSVTIGCRLYTKFYGDSSLAMGEQVDLILEVIDSASGNAVIVLDSLSVTAAEGENALHLERTLDLLSGTYYLRLRFASSAFPSRAVAYDCLYPVAEVAGWIPSPVAAKGVRRIDGEGGNSIRISAQPNPLTEKTEFRFSINKREHVTLTLYDAMGREVSRLVERELYERGRYAVDFDGSLLSPGTYIVELKTLNGRAVEKVVVQR
ncbi:MAG: T9SS type A sorting domain-containing protein [Ignavibacteriae bacterium]|nr:T9SS type A sorting domain-containing protein [Ignavibacteriota bacterium]MCB9217478.1 T9SS type A sorting domain-containing protein [Ignavibacteria bacterium]